VGERGLRVPESTVLSDGFGKLKTGLSPPPSHSTDK
jgi:hypothetical protein